jgi:hypothetical protein
MKRAVGAHHALLSSTGLLELEQAVFGGNFIRRFLTVDGFQGHLCLKSGAVSFPVLLHVFLLGIFLIRLVSLILLSSSWRRVSINLYLLEDTLSLLFPPCIRYHLS